MNNFKKSLSTRNTRFRSLIIIAIVSVVGVIVLTNSLAAIPVVSFEAESGNRSALAQLVQNNSSASSSSYIRFAAGTITPPPAGKKCTVSLHGAGAGSIGSTDWGRYNNQPVTLVQPRSPYGNFWLYDGPHNFQFDPTSSSDETYYNDTVTSITSVVNAAGCNGALLLMGQSNGGAMAAKMFCRGYNFNGRLSGLILDDPVPDQAVLNCNPQNLKYKTYLYSDGLTNEANQAGGVNYRCNSMPSQWYCENDTALPRTQFEQAIGMTGVRQRQFHSCTDPNNSSCGYVNNYESWGQQIDRFWRDFDTL
jgi:predicted esterase